MVLFVKDPDVAKLVGRLAAIRKVSKTEALRQALLHELEREEALPSLVERGVDYCRSLRVKANVASSKPADETFIDGLYEAE